MIFQDPRQSICLVGFTEPNDVRKIRPFTSKHPDRQILIAAIASFGKGLHTTPKNLPALFERDPDIGPTDPSVQNILYFSTDRQSDLLDQLCHVTQSAEGRLDAIFLNMPWPSVEDLETFRWEYENVQLFLKIGPEAYGLVKNSPRMLSRKLKRYQGIIEKVVLKPRERGRYEPFDTYQISDIINTLFNDNWYEIAFAGGLDSADLKFIGELLDDYPGLGVFAYRKLLNEDRLFRIEKAIELLENLLGIYAGK